MRTTPPFHGRIDSPIGSLLVTGSSSELAGLYFENHKYPPDRQTLGRRCDEVFGEVARQLQQYFAGQRDTFDIVIRTVGTEFQQQVWRRLLTIAAGQTLTYGDIAADLGKPKSARAVGAAVGRNPISIVIPCHRVVGSSGALTGFAGGIQRKRFLLDHERTGARLFPV